jgi:hypothetical protein
MARIELQTARTDCVTVVALLLAFTAVACDGGESRWAGTVTDSAGASIVSNPAGGLWTEADRWTVEEEQRIGAVEGDSAHEFGVILSGGIAVDSFGRVFVLDAQAQEIRVFSGEGEYLQTIGGRGGGPGEFAGARDVLMGPGDTLFVPDRRNQRMNRFAPDGSFLGSSRFSREEGLSVAFRANSSGVIAEQVKPLVNGSFWPDDSQDIFVTWTADGARSDSLAVFPSGQTTFMQGGALHTRWYAPEPCWDLTDNSGLLIGMNDEYRYRVLSPDGRVDRVVTKAHEPRPVRDQDVDRVRSHLENRLSVLGAPPDQIERLWSLQHFDKFFPAFLALHEGPAGTIWVQKVKPPSEMAEDEAPWFSWPSDWGVRDWDVFDPDGRYLGVVTMPARFTPSVFLDDRIYGLWRDELGVSYVLVLRIVGDLGLSAM